MTTTMTNAPATMVKASCDLMLRLRNIAIEGHKHWLATSARCANDALEAARTTAMRSPPAPGHGLPAAWAMPALGPWWETAVACAQRSMETALTNQAQMFEEGLEAGVAWRDACAQAMGAPSLGSSWQAPLDAFLATLRSAPASAPAASPKKPAARRR